MDKNDVLEILDADTGFEWMASEANSRSCITAPKGGGRFSSPLSRATFLQTGKEVGPNFPIKSGDLLRMEDSLAKAFFYAANPPSSGEDVALYELRKELWRGCRIPHAVVAIWGRTLPEWGAQTEAARDAAPGEAEKAVEIIVPLKKAGSVEKELYNLRSEGRTVEGHRVLFQFGEEPAPASRKTADSPAYLLRSMGISFLGDPDTGAGNAYGTIGREE